MRAWDLESGALHWEFELPSDGVWSVAFSQDGHQAISGSEDKSVILWNLDTCTDTCQEVHRFVGHQDAVYRVGISADGTTALSASADRRIFLWDLTTGLEIRRFEGHTLPVHVATYSDDGKTMISGSDDKTIRWWDLESGAEIFRFEGHSAQVQNLIFLPAEPENPDAPRILSRAKDGEMIQWSLPLTESLKLQEWTRANRYVRQLTCDEQRRYSVFELREACQEEVASVQQ
jgi:WD40 repeat protein